METSKFDINTLRVASPCPVGWEQMTGNDRTRHCDLCSLNVYNVSELSVDEVARLIGSGRERVCIRLYRRADGTVLTKDCPVGLRAYQKRVARFAGAVLSMILGLFSIGFAQKENGTTIDAQKAKITKTRDTSDKYNLRGTLVDPYGAVIPGFEVALYKQSEGKQREEKLLAKTTSDSNGEFAFSDVPKGRFLLRVKANYGFEGLTVTNIGMESGKLTELSLSLRLRGNTVTVGIIAEDPTVDMTIAGPTPTRISSETFDRLPIQRR